MLPPFFGDLVDWYTGRHIEMLSATRRKYFVWYWRLDNISHWLCPFKVTVQAIFLSHLLQTFSYLPISCCVCILDTWSTSRVGIVVQFYSNANCWNCKTFPRWAIFPDIFITCQYHDEVTIIVVELLDEHTFHKVLIFL